MPPLPLLQIHNSTLLIRTSFGDDHSWTSLRVAIGTPTEEGFLANVDLVDDPAYAAVGPSDLRRLLPEQHRGPYFFLVADDVALEGADHPILVVPIPYPTPELAWLDETPRPEFRVSAAHLWSVENNLSQANMDWRDFTNSADDGVFRGF